MNTKQFIQDLETLNAVLKTPSVKRRICTAAIIRIYAEAFKRIFEQGFATDGSAIGQYSTELIRVGDKRGLPRVKKRKFKNGKRRKTATYPGGYKQYREAVGRQGVFVDLNLTGALASSYNYEVGDRCIIGFTSAKEARKMTENEDRFGKTIAVPQRREIQVGIEAARREVIEIINEIL